MIPPPQPDTHNTIQSDMNNQSSSMSRNKSNRMYKLRKKYEDGDEDILESMDQTNFLQKNYSDDETFEK